MDAIVITGVQPFDGTYEFDLESDPLTTLEWRWIKKTSGYLPRTIADGFDGGDPDLVVAMAIIAMYRNAKISREDALRTAAQLDEVPGDGSRISMVFGQAEDAGGDDARPPEVSEGTVSSPTGSGEGSKQPTVLLGNGQSRIGDPTSLMHATSGQPTSAT